ncbi:MAG: hypothetical protein RMZ42_10720, partial [Nostoc sp. DedQUE05]|nr:hypothetical protein [Nostoc sp. DedQUE05]
GIGHWALGIGHWALGIGHKKQRGRGEKLSVTSPLLLCPMPKKADFLPELLVWIWNLELVIKIASENSIADT